MTELLLRIDQIEIKDLHGGRAEDVGPVLSQALTLLAERLADSPGISSPMVMTRAVDILRTEPIPAETLLRPGGAARLADDLFRALLSSRNAL